MSDYHENFTNEQLHHALAKAVAERDEAREMLRRIMDWSPCLPDYERDELHLKFQTDTFAARKFLEAAK